MQELESMHLRNKRALVRVDFNVPLDKNGSVSNDARIRATLPTLEHMLRQHCACVVMAHLGRPGGQWQERFSLLPVARRLAALLPEYKLRTCAEVIGDRARKMVEDLRGGQLLLLENLRFHPGEELADPGFASQLASLGEVYINDAFAMSHRKHASVYALAKRFPAQKRGIGFLMKREIEGLSPVVDSPERPFVAVLGGAKLSDKFEALTALLERVDCVLLGGALAYTFLQARGHEVGESRVERDRLEVARDILADAGEKLLLPRDHVIASKTGIAGDQIADHIPGDWAGYDIGPVTASQYGEKIRSARTVIWNGPMGLIEDDRYLQGTREIAESIASSGAMSIVGGGETGEVVHRLGLDTRYTHLSTGGGAFLSYIAHGTLPALEILR